jgi:hypothetical protein
MKLSYLWGHLKTISIHKYHVTKLCFRCGLHKQGILHDLSKFSWTELKTGAKYYNGTRSPNSIEREITGYSLAWLHHKGRNKHHWEYWVDFSRDGTYAAKMPVRYVAEMFCDRVAATKTYLKEQYSDEAPLAYYNKTSHYYVMEESTNAIIHDMLTYLSKHGLDETIAYIKQNYLL